MDEQDIFSSALLRWYDGGGVGTFLAHPRDAKKSARPDPYHVLVSEAMLQQTQVATVIPYFHRFLSSFPSFKALAEAPEQDVLRAWQGLGYYSRARNLHRAAKVVTDEFKGELPKTVEALRALPGVGRYTAGAVASIAFGERAPIVDGNVARVLCRLDRIETDPRDRETQELLWTRAADVLPTRRVGDFNSAMMELGATVCTPRNPQCLLCPVQRNCQAFKAGVQDRIPAPRKTKPTPLFRRWVFCLHRSADDRWLVEQRPSKGRWAGMWQFITLEHNDAVAPSNLLKSTLNNPVVNLKELGTVHHALTHRRYRFEALLGRISGNGKAPLKAPADAPNRKWLTLKELDEYPLPKPHVEIRRMLSGGGSPA